MTNLVKLTKNESENKYNLTITAEVNIPRKYGNEIYQIELVKNFTNKAYLSRISWGAGIIVCGQATPYIKTLEILSTIGQRLDEILYTKADFENLTIDAESQAYNFELWVNEHTRDIRILTPPLTKVEIVNL